MKLYLLKVRLDTTQHVALYAYRYDIYYNNDFVLNAQVDDPKQWRLYAFKTKKARDQQYNRIMYGTQKLKGDL